MRGQTKPGDQAERTHQMWTTCQMWTTLVV